VINTIKANYPALAREMGIGEGAEDIEQTFKGHKGMTMAETAVKHVEEVLSINKCLNQGEVQTLT
jgi:hypothetical protein